MVVLSDPKLASFLLFRRQNSAATILGRHSILILAAYGRECVSCCLAVPAMQPSNASQHNVSRMPAAPKQAQLQAPSNASLYAMPASMLYLALCNGSLQFQQLTTLYNQCSLQPLPATIASTKCIVTIHYCVLNSLSMSRSTVAAASQIVHCMHCSSMMAAVK